MKILIKYAIMGGGCMALGGGLVLPPQIFKNLFRKSIGNNAIFRISYGGPPFLYRDPPDF